MALRFDETVCLNCPSVDCLMKCQYMAFEPEAARQEIWKLIRGEDCRLLRECRTCYACEEYCRRGNHPFYLISERREEKGIYTAPRPITRQWFNMTAMQGKPLIGAVTDQALSCCFIPLLGELGRGKLFEKVESAAVFGPEFMCPAVHSHFAKMSVIQERLPRVIENFVRLGVKEVICLHDECYGTFTAIAPAYGIEVPFTPVYYMDYLLERLEELRDHIRPLGVKVAYQRPCSNRLIPHKHRLVKEILNRIGAELMERTYQDEKALCCGEILRTVAGWRLADDVQGRNLDDMVQSGAEYCVFNCPACQTSLAAKVSAKGLKPIHLIDLCKMAIGEKEREG